MGANSGLDLHRGHEKRQVGNTYTAKVRINQKYNIIGFISSGTYGRVYKAVEKNSKGDTSSPVGTSPSKELYAIKKYVLSTCILASDLISCQVQARERGR
jgi:serine/threonine protein kinase